MGALAVSERRVRIRAFCHDTVPAGYSLCVDGREAAVQGSMGAPNVASEAVMNDIFRKFAHRTSMATGSSWAFVAAVLIIVVWAVSGPIFGFSDTWQLVINTGTTIITFLMVFLIQNTQTRDGT